MSAVLRSCHVPISRRWNRMLHLGIAGVLACGLGLCALVRPDPSGVGTHRQLGLPGCLICLVTGMDRCPSCGLTTGFAHLVRGHWQEARAANRAAPVVFIGCCFVLGYCLMVASVGANWLAHETAALAALCSLGFAVWLTALW